MLLGSMDVKLGVDANGMLSDRGLEVEFFKLWIFKCVLTICDCLCLPDPSETFFKLIRFRRSILSVVCWALGTGQTSAWLERVVKKQAEGAGRFLRKMLEVRGCQVFEEKSGCLH